ncbi:MAG: menaquinone biosynthesis decarboxylase, partial [Candidatus Omnitrophica bacterium]|nr:menaquinone biosynthesis decarboxylase [Candidatus Omnitrophota bacterium]
VDALDHASSSPLIGSKIGIDATRKLPEECFRREWPPDIKMSQDVIDKINSIWGKL